MKGRLLLISDDANIGTLLPDYLSEEVEVTEASEPVGGYDFCLIALNNRDTLCDQLRALRLSEGGGKRTMVYVYHHAWDVEAVKACYAAGADDCIAMPIVPDLLLAKLRAAMARMYWLRQTLPTRFEKADVAFDAVEQTLRVGSNERRLSPKENGVLLMLFREANACVDRHRILQEVWREDSYFSNRSLAVYMHHLRTYLKESKSVKIMNLPGEGYKLVC